MKRIRPKKQGRIIPNDVKPEPHELDIILFYTGIGKDVEIIPTSHTPGNKSPDYIIDNIAWEAKSLLTATRKAAERIFYRASCQSCNIIMDLRHLKADTDVILVLEKCFKNTRRVRRMHIITKNEELKIYTKSH